MLPARPTYLEETRPRLNLTPPPPPPGTLSCKVKVYPFRATQPLSIEWASLKNNNPTHAGFLSSRGYCFVNPAPTWINLAEVGDPGLATSKDHHKSCPRQSPQRTGARGMVSCSNPRGKGGSKPSRSLFAARCWVGAPRERESEHCTTAGPTGS
ncbi:hypothetical protein LX36DRAFT_439705 [Colletotrichum falcatum]|nr:hypothetical protein LX36DRAFT_439705 [Colletotrichum falcatum]